MDDDDDDNEHDIISEKSSKDVLAVFPKDQDREQLKQAILECCRAEVVRSINDILLGQTIRLTPKNSDSSFQSEPKQADTTKSCSILRQKHRQRPQTAKLGPPTRLQSDGNQRPKTSHEHAPDLGNKPASQKTIPLESVCCRVDHVPPIDRSSFNLLARSSAIVAKATGEPPTKFNDAFKSNGNDHISYSSPPKNDDSADEDQSTDDDLPEDEEAESMDDDVQRVDSWPESFRPTTATRMIHTSHAVLKNKPSKRRPLTTTALERRKPPPSTAASERSKAQQFSQRLLGPITLESKRPNYDFVIPNCLAANEWENELARNIISVFSNKARSEIKGEQSLVSSSSATVAAAVEQLPPMVASSSLFATNNDTADEYEFRGEDFVRNEGSDFQRISISRGVSCINEPDNEFYVESPEKRKCVPKAKKSEKRSIPSGTFRLKMIWFTGTGMVHANWNAINGQYKIVL